MTIRVRVKASAISLWHSSRYKTLILTIARKRAPATGRLSFSWPHAMDQAAAAARLKGPLFPFGHGLQTRAVG
ncbi:Hypothetical protein EMIHUDRAFT_206568 [Emiliania huxleyi CCMP1516]|uniref:Uncharacterized protein n=2 Tax=Emiliania huxleyi TaxID=2903 RepID=A0A0D3JM32_EMIH1|nr:Hypothetical protein EMIHUDRAFT_206568 [Emiliania huxleyi CCMP1516]EOD24567.1 Hypothetical protein EMIHUDRAFT_206568 [Emiliania huxleyi CCMP1516]|eukprot:XP_005776996.1 Hypothetical protein EMIHUDRAFT_206568 [Emiliania huxleyi CCMP1516]